MRRTKRKINGYFYSMLHNFLCCDGGKRERDGESCVSDGEGGLMGRGF